MAESDRSYLHHVYRGRSRITMQGFEDASAGSSIALASPAGGNLAHQVRVLSLQTVLIWQSAGRAALSSLLASAAYATGR